MKLRQKIALFLTAGFISAVLAATYGPFHISAVGGEDYVTLDFRSDQSAEFAGAKKLAGIYLTPLLNTAAKIRAANKGDYIRVVYADGQIADFRIRRWPSSDAIDFDSLMPSANSKHLSEEQLDDFERRMNACSGGAQGAYSVLYPTGFWGSSVTDLDDGGVLVTGFWVDTGLQSYTVPSMIVRCVPR